MKYQEISEQLIALAVELRTAAALRPRPVTIPLEAAAASLDLSAGALDLAGCGFGGLLDEAASLTDLLIVALGALPDEPRDPAVVSARTQARAALATARTALTAAREASETSRAVA